MQLLSLLLLASSQESNGSSAGGDWVVPLLAAIITAVALTVGGMLAQIANSSRERQHWVRQVRFDAYEDAFLALRTLHEWDGTPADPGWERAWNAAEEKVRFLQLVGPEAVARHGHQWMNWIEDWQINEIPSAASQATEQSAKFLSATARALNRRRQKL